MDSWLLVPCQRSRVGLLHRLLGSLQHPPDRVVVVATLPDPILPEDVTEVAAHVLLHKEPEQFISRWWNQGLAYIAGLADTEHEVLAVSSDYVGTADSVRLLARFLREHDLGMVGPDHHSAAARFWDLTTPRGVLDRVPGACWMLRGELGLRVDEDYRWWYSDDDLEMQARQHGRVGVLPGTGLLPGADTPLSQEKQRWAAEERRKFTAKWGIEPW